MHYSPGQDFGANSSFPVKYRTAGRFQFLSFSNFLLVLTKFLFWEEDWTLGYNSMKFRDFPDLLSCSEQVVSNSYIPCLLLIITLRFTCGEKKI